MLARCAEPHWTRDAAPRHLAEADEEAAVDHSDDLAGKRRLPAELEQMLLEQPGEAELVGGIFDACRLSLPL
jgi:hypothetical protein